jgi:hypothetical protein
MSLAHFRRIGLPLVAVIAVSAAAAPAVASPGTTAGTGIFKSWTKAQQEAQFKLMKPGTTYGLHNVGYILVTSCLADPRKRDVLASYGSILHKSLALEQDNAGTPCHSGYPGTALGTYTIHRQKAHLFGYCGFGAAPKCSSTDIELWLTWKVKGDYYVASAHDESRKDLVHFADVLKKV